MNHSNTLGWDFLKSTFLLCGLALLIFFINGILQSKYETLVTMTSGAHALSALKLQLFIPKLAVFGVFAVCYRFDRIKTFFYLAGSSFFLFFAFLAVSDRALQSDQIITLNYFVSSMWPMIMYSLLFWVAANQRFTTKQASIAYPVILILASLLGTNPAALLLRYTQDISVLYTVVSISLLALIALCTRLFNDSKDEPESPDHPSISLCQKFIYISILALIFVCGDVVNQGLDHYLKVSVKSEFSDIEAYTHVMRIFSVFQLSVSMLVIFMTCWMAWAFSWRMSALITPVVCLVLLRIDWHAEMNPMLYENFTTLVDGFPQDGASLLILSLLVGVFRGLLPVLFLTTKQMAFIPLPSSTKARANAFIAVILGGKVISGFIFIQSLTLFESAKDTQWLTFPIVAGLLVWIAAILLLAKRYEALNAMKMA